MSRRWLLSGFALLALLYLAGTWILRAELRRQSVERGNLIDAAELSRLQNDVANLKAEMGALQGQVDDLKSELQTERQWRDSTREKVQKLEMNHE